MGSLAHIRYEADALEAAAELVRLLGAVERAYLLDEHEKVENLLGQISEPQCAGLADDLSALAAMARGGLLTSLSPLPPAAGARRPSPSGALAPVVPLDPYSRKV